MSATSFQKAKTLRSRKKNEINQLISNRVDAVIWMGDFNSRTDEIVLNHKVSHRQLNTKDSALQAIGDDKFELLYKHDQFNMDYQMEKVAKLF